MIQNDDLRVVHTSEMVFGERGCYTSEILSRISVRTSTSSRSHTYYRGSTPTVDLIDWIQRRSKIADSGQRKDERTTDNRTEDNSLPSGSRSKSSTHT